MKSRSSSKQTKAAPYRRTKLDREMIVDAAIARAENHGLDELSARKLAQDLGCEAMSLYHHVGSMEALKDLIVDRLLGSIAPAKATGPAEALSEETRAYLDLATKYPRAFELVATRRWKGESAVAVALRSIGYIGDLGFNPPEALKRARALGAYLNGAGLALAAWAKDITSSPQGDAKQVTADLLWGLELLLQSTTEASDSVEN